jgi:PAS domain S-box-containing protein
MEWQMTQGPVRHIQRLLPRSLRQQFRLILTILATLIAAGSLLAVTALRHSAAITRQLAAEQLIQMEHGRELAHTALLIERETRSMLSTPSPERMAASYTAITTLLDTLDRLTGSLGATNDVAILPLYQAEQNFRNLVHTVAGLRSAELRSGRGQHTHSDAFRRFREELERQALELVVATDTLAERGTERYRVAVRRLAEYTDKEQYRVLLLLAGCLATAWLISRMFLERHLLSRLQQVCCHLLRNNDDGTPTGIPVQGEDEIGEMARAVEQFIENRRQLDVANRALHQSNDLLRAVFAAAPTAIFGLDLDGNVCLVWNSAAERMLGWSEAEVMGHPYPAVPSDQADEFRAILQRISKGESLNGIEANRIRHDGSPIVYSIFAAPLHDADNRVTSSIIVLVDITERKQMENQLAERTAELEAKNNELERLNKVFIGRELKMVELKERIRELEAK